MLQNVNHSGELLLSNLSEEQLLSLYGGRRRNRWIILAVGVGLSAFGFGMMVLGFLTS